ncbi:MAG: hypothetical protein ABI587_05385 [Gemmatimonadales bacterium]
MSHFFYRIGIGAVLTTLASAPASAQTPHPIFASATLSLGRPEGASDPALLGDGFGQHLRLGYRFQPQWAATLEVTNLFIGRNNNVFNVPCPAPVCAAGPFLGPLRVTTVGLGLHGSAPVGGSKIAVTAGPSLAWFYTRPAATSAIRPAVGASAMFGLGTRGPLHPMVEVEYRQFLGATRALESVLSLGVGVELP